MSATIEMIRAVRNSAQFSEADKAVVRWQFRMCGSFYSALWQAIALADDDNLARLERGFPVEVEGYRNWAYGDLGARLREFGLEI